MYTDIPTKYPFAFKIMDRSNPSLGNLRYEVTADSKTSTKNIYVQIMKQHEPNEEHVGEVKGFKRMFICGKLVNIDEYTFLDVANLARTMQSGLLITDSCDS